MNTITGRNLKALREANGYTQEKMAEYLGVGRSAYANYEAGERETPLEVLQKAADLFGCELALLFEEDETAVRNMLVCAFRADDLSADDMREVASFKSVVMNYLKMERLPQIVNNLPICDGCFSGKYPVEPPTEDIRGDYER